MPSEGGIFFSFFSGGTSPVKGPPLVLIHGAGGTHLHWPPQFRRLEGEKVYGLDLPGHGRSEGEPACSIEEYAVRISKWLDVLGLSQLVLVGHSMGGAISLRICLDEPSRVAGLVLVGSGAKLRVHPDILSLTESETTYQQAAELVTSWAFSEGTPARMKELAVSRMAEMPAHVVHADFLACDQFDIMHRLSEIEVPALVFCGTQDYLTPVKYSQYLVEHLPNAQIELIEGAGHMVMLENPQAMLTPLRNFLDRL